jgi:hypothetical protein
VRDARAASINWPANQNSVPTLLRVDRSLTAAIRPEIPAAFHLTASPDAVKVRAGQSVTLTLKLERRWPEAKGPVQILAANLPANISCAPLTLGANQTEAKATISVGPKVLPGRYSLVIWGQLQAPFSVSPEQKSQNVTMLLPANPLLLTVSAD